MACTGPFVVMLGVGIDGGMSAADINSWVLAGYGFGGVLSIILSLVYRMPMGMGWTIPGTIILGGALSHLPFEECVGAFYIVGAIVTVLGLSGWVQRVARYIPLSIVMAMVAGVFLPFVLKIVLAFADSRIIATASVLAFIAAAAVPAIARYAPPVLFAIVVGGAAALGHRPGVARDDAVGVHRDAGVLHAGVHMAGAGRTGDTAHHHRGRHSQPAGFCHL